MVERRIYCRGSRVEDGKKRWTSWKKKKESDHKRKTNEKKIRKK